MTVNLSLSLKMSLVLRIVLILILGAITKCEIIEDNGVMPLKLQLHLLFDGGNTSLESYLGNAAIQFKLTKNTKNIEIVFSGIVNHIQINNLNDSIEIRNFEYSVNNGVYRVKINDSTNFKINNVYEIWLNFSQTEFGRGLEKTFALNGSPIVYTSDFQCSFPNFGANHIQSLFQLKITHNSSLTAISITSGTRTVDDKTNLTTTQFEETPTVSRNLVGFVIGQFTSHQIKNHHDFPLHMYGPESKITNYFGKIFSEYEKYLDSHIPELKLDLVAIPKLPMNYMMLGLIFVEEEMFFDRIDPRDALIGINMVSKGMGDHFLSNSIESEPKWFKNGLTSYLANKMLQNLEPNIAHIIAFEDLNEVMNKEYAIAGFNLAKDVEYHKSAAIIRMVEQVVGASKFQTCLRNALKFKQNFKELLEKSFDEQINFNEFMDVWTNHKGYPIVKIVRNYETGELFISQSGVDTKTEATWFIPYNFANKSNPNFNETDPDGWLTNFNKSIMLDVSANDWIIFNKQAIGYYLVIYDEKNLNLIIDELTNGSIEVIHPLNRANLLTTGYILTLSKDMAEETFLKLISYLVRENDPRPWFVADKILEKLYKDSYDREKTYVDQLNNIILSISQDLYDKYTIGKNPFTRYIAMKWSCRVGHAKCLKDFDQVSIAYLNSIVNDNTIVMPPDMMDLMLCYGFRNESDYIKLYSYDSNEFRQMIKNRIDCHLDTNVFRWEFMRSFIFKMFNYRTYFDQLNWMEYLEFVPGFNLRIGDLVFGVFEKNLNEFDMIYEELRDTELKQLPFKYINELLARHRKQAFHQGYDFNRTRFDLMVTTIKRKYGEVAAESLEA